MGNNGRKGGKKNSKLNLITKFSTWNVRGKISDPFWRQRLEEDLKKSKIAVCCLQETKWQEDSDFLLPGGGRIINIAAKASIDNKIHYGMGLYISESWDKRYMGSEHVSDRISVSKFRILKDTKRPLIIINVYGPSHGRTLNRDMTEVEDFYEELKQVVEKWKPKASMVFVAGDFNSRIGQKKEEDSEIMGVYTKGPRNIHGQYLADLLHESRMFLSNTTFKHRDHHIATWHGSNVVRDSEGNEIRRKGIHNQIDYIAILQRHKGMITNARSYQGVKYETDHSRVTMEIRLKALYPVSNKRVAIKPKYDLSTLYWNEEIRGKYIKQIDKDINKYKNAVAANEYINGPANISIADNQDSIKHILSDAIQSSVPIAPKKVGGRIVYCDDIQLKKMSDKRAKLWKTFTNSKLSANIRQKAYNERK
jgi:exonuclease III